jgi:hypothetical protein
LPKTTANVPPPPPPSLSSSSPSLSSSASPLSSATDETTIEHDSSSSPVDECHAQGLEFVTLHLTKSATFFYSAVQQFCRDMQNICHPSFATSSISSVFLTLLDETEGLLLEYFQDIWTVLENPKTWHQWKFAQVRHFIDDTKMM